MHMWEGGGIDPEFGRPTAAGRWARARRRMVRRGAARRSRSRSHRWLRLPPSSWGLDLLAVAAVQGTLDPSLGGAVGGQCMACTGM